MKLTDSQARQLERLAFEGPLRIGRDESTMVRVTKIRSLENRGLVRRIHGGTFVAITERGKDVLAHRSVQLELGAEP